ncbi:hypothetical protein [Cohnella yongneupensis]|uniref:Uncharacterized protein n=1 Tax=Cohnella yongneupensis TaxID=425006 RepID=A0ABW0QYM5_9BACL
MNKRSVVSKLMSALLTSMIVSIYAFLTYADDSGDRYFWLVSPVFFLVFAFVCFIATPISMFIDHAVSKIDNKVIVLTVYLSLALAGFVVVAGLWELFVNDLTIEVILYGLASLYMFLLFDYAISKLESYAKNINNDV